MLTEGAASLDGEPLELFSLYILAPGNALTLQADSAARALLLGGEAFATQRHVWWNFVSSSARPDRAGQGRLDRPPLPARPRRRGGMDPDPRRAQDGQLPMIEQRRHAARRPASP